MRLARERDPVRGDHPRQDFFVAVFFPCIQRERVAQFRVVERRRVRGHPQTRATFGLHRDVPDRQRDDALQRRRFELRPREHGRAIRIEGFAKHPAHFAAVRVGAGDQRAARGAGPVAHRVVGGIESRAVGFAVRQLRRAKTGDQRGGVECVCYRLDHECAPGWRRKRLRFCHE
ncbi:hypothetical protein [Burkholderia sp. SRS-W-2-2016]|uniref:hypothetical protein n=1 Tax=Burkholderia sp. SRS-W-2-2016 TaxID=1926878 RepID=UPI000AC48495|nr:hypothetical protein [Burkholderia sp. SRS-W-2-2016]